jgi:hypothetical protein
VPVLIHGVHRLEAGDGTGDDGNGGIGDRVGAHRDAAQQLLPLPTCICRTLARFEEECADLFCIGIPAEFLPQRPRTQP